MDIQAAQAQVGDVAVDGEDLVRIHIPDQVQVLDHLVEQVPLKAVQVVGGAQVHQVHIYLAVPQVHIHIHIHIHMAGAQAQEPAGRGVVAVNCWCREA